mmetsp:Transcript_4264/g.15718  ORF Transcript_4264/g.15718 Transcript_4264/m.15718 type:complete len:525 (+) Transcript_4264:407-1981(+)
MLLQALEHARLAKGHASAVLRARRRARRRHDGVQPRVLRLDAHHLRLHVGARRADGQPVRHALAQARVHAALAGRRVLAVARGVGLARLHHARVRVEVTRPHAHVLEDLVRARRALERAVVVLKAADELAVALVRRDAAALGGEVVLAGGEHGGVEVDVRGALRLQRLHGRQARGAHAAVRRRGVRRVVQQALEELALVDVRAVPLGLGHAVVGDGRVEQRMLSLDDLLRVLLAAARRRQVLLVAAQALVQAALAALEAGAQARDVRRAPVSLLRVLLDVVGHVLDHRPRHRLAAAVRDVVDVRLQARAQRAVVQRVGLQLHLHVRAAQRERRVPAGAQQVRREPDILHAKLVEARERRAALDAHLVVLRVLQQARQHAAVARVLRHVGAERLDGRRAEVAHLGVQLDVLRLEQLLGKLGRDARLRHAAAVVRARRAAALLDVLPQAVVQVAIAGLDIGAEALHVAPARLAQRRVGRGVLRLRLHHAEHLLAARCLLDLEVLTLQAVDDDARVLVRRALAAGGR